MITYVRAILIDWLKQREQPTLQAESNGPSALSSGVHPVHLQALLLVVSVTRYLVDVKREIGTT